MIDTATFVGAPAGSNLAVSPHEIDDSQARYIQDAFVDQPGIIRQRGIIVSSASVLGSSAGRVHLSSGVTGFGMAFAKQPNGVGRTAIIYTGNGLINTSLAVLSADLSTQSPITWGATGYGPTPTVYPIVDSKPALGGGSVIGITDQLSNPGAQSLGFWNGAGKLPYATGTVSTTVGSPVVTGSGTAWTANIEPGMYLFVNTGGTITYFGDVKSVDSNTQITLTGPSPFTVIGPTYQLQSLRGFQAKYARGVITTSTSSTQVTGGDTRFKGNLTSTPTWWSLFRKSTGELIGTVSSIQTDSSLTLQSNATVNLDAEPFIAIYLNTNASPDVTSVGFLSTTHKGRQFYANKSDTAKNSETVWYSDPDDKEVLDLNPTDGSFFPVTSSSGTNAPLAAMASTQNALLFLKENEAFAMTGDEPEQWTLDTLPINDGTLSTMSVQQIDDGVIFAGRRGIYKFDGSGITNLTDGNLGGFYHDLVSTFDPTKHRMWSMVARNHYFLVIEAVTPPYLPIRGNSVQTVEPMTIAIHLPTNAITFHTNMDFRGSVELPASSEQESLFLLNVIDAPQAAAVVSTLDLFDSINAQGGVSQDQVQSVHNTLGAGPLFYVESKRYSLGDALRKKLFKEILLTYMSTIDTLSVDVVTGLNDTGTTLASTFPVSGTFSTARLKFLKRAQLLGFRIYGTFGNTRQIVLGPWALGSKLMRPGRP